MVASDFTLISRVMSHGMCSAQAVEVQQAADEHTAQAGAAGQRATAAEQEAQHLEGQGKFADAAAAALQADRSALLPLLPLVAIGSLNSVQHITCLVVQIP